MKGNKVLLNDSLSEFPLRFWSSGTKKKKKKKTPKTKKNKDKRPPRVGRNWGFGDTPPDENPFKE
ncbi:MAG: hypothetical protein ACRBFS_24315 [Aureispira sp.]